MALTKLVNYKEASPKVKKIFDDIMKTRKTKYVNNIWRALIYGSENKIRKIKSAALNRM